MRSKEYDYVAARLIEEREAVANSTTPEGRKAHQELAARYAQILNAFEQGAATHAANLA